MNDYNSQPKDQNVLSFMMSLVQEKYGDEVDIEFLNNESSRLYDIFGEQLVHFFEPMLTVEQKKAFDDLVQKQGKQEELLDFLIKAIPNLETQILQVLISFKMEYLKPDSSLVK